MTDSGGGVHSIVLWDAPVRIFHWSLTILIGCSWWTAETDRMAWHRWSGYAILTLLIFRLSWGVFGSETARFTQFLRGPSALIRYIRHSLLPKSPKLGQIGHNPLGGWSVVGLLTMLLSQAALGLFSVDTDGVESGPLADLLSFEQGRKAAHFHHLLFSLIQLLVLLHLAAILFYWLARQDNLIRPMISGRKEVPLAVPAPYRVGISRAALLAALALAVTILVINLPALLARL